MCMIGAYERKIRVPQDAPLVAWRLFIRSADGRLWATHAGNAPWPRRVPLTARCGFEAAQPVAPTHIPRFDCQCGFWAFKTPGKARHKKRATFSRCPIVIVRQVRLWGRVAVHADGYRAQYAQVN